VRTIRSIMQRDTFAGWQIGSSATISEPIWWSLDKICSTSPLVFSTWKGSAPVDWGRPHVLESLNREPGSQLVLVDYHFMAGQSNYNEWVFNSADLVSQMVLWAHRMEPQESDRDLECFFAGRQPWLVTIGYVGEEFREQYSVQKLPRHSCTVAPQK
jgi:hypothetical protein